MKATEGTLDTSNRVDEKKKRPVETVNDEKAPPSEKAVDGDDMADEAAEDTDSTTTEEQLVKGAAPVADSGLRPHTQ